LVDAALSAEVRRLLVPPGDTLERLLAGRTTEARLQESLSLPELTDDGEPEDEVSGKQTLAEGRREHRESPAHWFEAPRSAAPSDGMEDPRNELGTVFRAIEHTHPDEVDQASNSYPTLPSPPAEGARNDPTVTVLRLIAGTSVPAS
jgi:hypothetical protein